jgi:hypothetical protein
MDLTIEKNLCHRVVDSCLERGLFLAQSNAFSGGWKIEIKENTSVCYLHVLGEIPPYQRRCGC